MMLSGQEVVLKPQARLQLNNVIYNHGVLYSIYDKLNLFEDMRITEARHRVPQKELLVISQNKIALNARFFTACPLEYTNLKMSRIFHEIYAE
jgi:hypothetical protein